MANYKVTNKKNLIQIKRKSFRPVECNQAELQCFNTRQMPDFFHPILEGKNLIYSAPDSISLENYMKKGFSVHKYYSVVAQTIEVHKKIEMFGLHANNLVLDPSIIHVKEATGELVFLYEPIINKESNVGLYAFIMDLIRNVRPDDQILLAEMQRMNDFLMSPNSRGLMAVEQYVASRYPQIYQQITRAEAGLSAQIMNDMLGGRPSATFNQSMMNQQMGQQALNPVASQQGLGQGALNSAAGQQGMGQGMKNSGANGAGNGQVAYANYMSHPSKALNPSQNPFNQYGAGGVNSQSGAQAPFQTAGQPGTKSGVQMVAEQGASFDVPSRDFGDFDDEMGGTTLLVEEEDEGTTLLCEEPAVVAKLIRNKTGETILVDSKQFMVGKANDNAFCITGNSAISRKHACIYNDNGMFSIADMNSTNHTFVNEQMVPMNQFVSISDGDRIKFADEEFLFQVTHN